MTMVVHYGLGDEIGAAMDTFPHYFVTKTVFTDLARKNLNLNFP